MESSLDYPCPICNSENGLILNVHTSEIPYFGEHTEMTIICNECGWRNTDFIPSEGKKPSFWSLVIDNSELMTTRVVRSSSCTVRIVELGLEVEPGDNATGYISNVEGVLNRFSDAIAMIQNSAIRESEERKVSKCYVCSTSPSGGNQVDGLPPVAIRKLSQLVWIWTGQRQSVI